MVHCHLIPMGIVANILVCKLHNESQWVGSKLFTTFVRTVLQLFVVVEEEAAAAVWPITSGKAAAVLPFMLGEAAGMVIVVLVLLGADPSLAVVVVVAAHYNVVKVVTEAAYVNKIVAVLPNVEFPSLAKWPLHFECRTCRMNVHERWIYSLHVS